MSTTNLHSRFVPPTLIRDLMNSVDGKLKVGAVEVQRVQVVGEIAYVRKNGLMLCHDGTNAKSEKVFTRHKDFEEQYKKRFKAKESVRVTGRIQVDGKKKVELYIIQIEKICKDEKAAFEASCEMAKLMNSTNGPAYIESSPDKYADNLGVGRKPDVTDRFPQGVLEKVPVTQNGGKWPQELIDLADEY